MQTETTDRKRGRQDLKELARLAAEMPRTPPPPPVSTERASSPLAAPPPSARISMEPMVLPTPQPFQPVLGAAPAAKKARSFAPAMFIGACVVVGGCAIAITAMVMKRPQAPQAAAAIFVAPPTTATQAVAPPAADSTATATATPTATPTATSTSTPTATPNKTSNKGAAAKAKVAAAPPANTPSGTSLEDSMRKAVGK